MAAMEATLFVAEDADDEEGDDGDDDGIPAFGLLVALAALAIGASLRLRARSRHDSSG